jgi:hypothetical protein
MSNPITPEQYASAMHTLVTYIKQLNKAVELECMQHILMSLMQEINRQIVKVKDYERIQAECEKEIERVRALRNE